MGEKNITLVITGSIAAVKSYDLIQQLQAKGIGVSVVLTDSAQQWITPDAAKVLTALPVITSSEIRAQPDQLKQLLAKSDAIVAAPASADFIKQLVYNDSELAKAINNCQKPVAVAPAMNVMMWQHPATQRNSKKLLSQGVQILGPVLGKMACGDEGYGRFMEPSDIAPALESLLAGKSHPAFELVNKSFSPKPALPAIDVSLAAKKSKKLLLMIQGGKDALATYALISSLRSRGYQVTCATGDEATKLLPAEGLATISGCTAYNRHYQDDVQGMEHIRLPEQSDIVLITPATCDGVKEMAEGGAQSFLGCAYLATKKPVVLVPSTDIEKQPNAADLERIRQDGVNILTVPKQLHPASKERADAIADGIDELIKQQTLERKIHGN
jgi:phosphopantothenoylcysteine decarboxylase/phosphopantothenate--cysteine ligase